MKAFCDVIFAIGTLAVTLCTSMVAVVAARALGAETFFTGWVAGAVAVWTIRIINDMRGKLA